MSQRNRRVEEREPSPGVLKHRTTFTEAENEGRSRRDGEGNELSEAWQ